MKKALIYGAGSIGNHFAHALTKMGCKVYVEDISIEALERMRSQLYPQRYGRWDESIECSLVGCSKLDDEECSLDLVVVGTPPQTHLEILKAEIDLCRSKAIIIEKPVCVPQQLSEMHRYALLARERGILVCAGYNHTQARSFRFFIEAARELSTIKSVNVKWLESVEGILNAHPWLDGIKDSYLGYTQNGGGALFEHSHGLHMGVVALRELCGSSGILSIEKKEIRFDKHNEMDVKSSVTGTYENGGCETYVLFETDFETYPAIKQLSVSTIDGQSVLISFGTDSDTVSLDLRHRKQSIVFSKDRPSDFMCEIENIFNANPSLSFVKLDLALDVIDTINSILTE